MKKVSLMFLVILQGCIAPIKLTPAGEKVKYVTKEEAPKNCKEMAELSYGESITEVPDSVTEVKNGLRNKAGALGANLLVIETLEKEYANGSYYYQGTGRAYQCP